MAYAIEAILLENILLKKTGQGFEDIFNDLAKQKWGEDFEPWKAQGRIGDFKCDGYHVPDRIVFQCYGPEQPNPSTIANKISKDFQGAKENFGDNMAKWVFVYNQRELPATCSKLLCDLREQNPIIEIRWWSVNDLLKLAMELSLDRLSVICGAGLQGHKFQEATIDALEKHVSEHKGPPAAPDDGPAVPTNQPTLEQALDDIAVDDREIRRCILGYSMWLDPMLKEQAHQQIAKLELDVAAIDSNVERLSQMGLIRVTTLHILPVDKKICSEAAEAFADEFIARLDSL